MSQPLPTDHRAVPTRAWDSKQAVHDFWDAASCGEVYAEGESLAQQYETHARARYALEPYIRTFARFEEGAGRDVLEIGVGMGADHLQWSGANPRSLTGVDLTPRAVEHTRRRLAFAGRHSNLEVADGERLPFPDDSFDIVYSWGVLHHSPNTARAVGEVRRVLRPGGVARVMIYHTHSLVGDMLWLRYALLAGRPRRPMADVYAHHLESPGTKTYTVEEARALFKDFRHVDARSALSFGDLLEGAVGQRHGGPLLTLAKRVWPRWLFRRLVPRRGLMLLVDAVK